MEGVFLIMLPLVTITVLLMVTHYFVYFFEWAIERIKEALQGVA